MTISPSVIDEFWKWFSDNSLRLKRISTPDCSEYRDLEAMVARLRPELRFEIGGRPDSEGFEFILTAHGAQELFSDIDEVVSRAPRLRSWQVRALKPPLLEEFSIAYEGEKFSAANVFVREEPTAAPNLLNLKVGLAQSKSQPPSDREKEAIGIIVESYLGERAFSTHVATLEVVTLPLNPREHGFTALSELASKLSLCRIQ
jgi:hypothetical protein